MIDTQNHIAACIPHIKKLLMRAPRPSEEVIDYVAQGLHTGIKDAKQTIEYLTDIGAIKKFKVFNKACPNVTYISLADQSKDVSGRLG